MPLKRFAKKAVQEPYIYHELHNSPKRFFSNDMWSPLDHLVLACFDPGLTNLGVCIQTRYRGGKIETNRLERFQFKDSDNVYADMVRKFDTELLDDLKRCHYIFVERQLKVNYKALRAMQHILSYLVVRLHDSELHPIIIEVPPVIKSKAIGKVMVGGKLGKVSKPELKKLSVDAAISLLDERQDDYGMYMLLSERKRDDRADAYMTIEACYDDLKIDGHILDLGWAEVSNLADRYEYLEKEKNKKMAGLRTLKKGTQKAKSLESEIKSLDEEMGMVLIKWTKLFELLDEK